MATPTKPAPSRKPELSLTQILDKKFRIPPVNIAAKDGSRRHFKVEHRIGKDDRYFLMETLIDDLGFMDEVVDKARIYEKLGKKVFEKEFKRLVADARSSVSTAVRAYKSGYMAEFYRNQGIAPIISFMPGVDPKHPKRRGVYIVGFYDTASLTPVLGEIDEITLSLELSNARLRGAVDQYRENQGIAKQSLGLPGVNKDLANRLQRIVAGEVTRKLIEQQGKK